MLSYKYLFDLALILISTKLLGLLTRRIQMPQVVGALLAGLIMGPAMLNILHETNFIQQMAELGVIVLMFTAGLETDMKELEKTGKASMVIALLGVLLPLAGGFIIASLFNKGSGADAHIVMQNIFIGIILTATSVSITVETLKELGKLNTKVGNAILGAALIDDILGIIGLTVIISLADPTVSILWVLIKIVLFFVCSIATGFIFYVLFGKWVERYDKGLRRFVIVAFVFCLLLAFVAEEFFGVADITGAFIAGLIISNTQKTKYIAARFDTMSYILLSPIFFASIGIMIEMPKMSGSIIWFTVLLLVVAVLSKVLGCALGAKICKFSNKEALRIGVGMVSRGEVALIVASKGAAVGLMSAAFFGPVVVMVVVTTIITPILLKLVFRKSKNQPINEQVDSDLVNKYEETLKYE
ncbi:MAG: sodium/hydrogen exchanger family protein [Clostridia bacterium]|jgi:Kef-type K+ transport system membrane component KefB|nr:sodium/hydrogen exchanger family protein [Clostridia bacterium]